MWEQVMSGSGIWVHNLKYMNFRGYSLGIKPGAAGPTEQHVAISFFVPCFKKV